MTQRSIPTLRLPLAIRHPIALYCGAGILTCCPSATHLCLTLGADSPCADERCAGNLGLTARETFTPFIATHVSILTSDTSSKPLGSPSQAYRTLSYHDSVHQTTLPRTPPLSVQWLALRSRAKRNSHQCRLGDHCRPQLRSIA